MQESKLIPSVPRRAHMQECTPEENQITELIWAIEKLGGSLKLTTAVILLGQAKDALADHIEGIE